jgi:pimeloyl-ACP methyl ester carboxylesterase
MSILKEMEQHGAYAPLSNGKVRYELAGPESAELVVLVHGLIGHMHVWDYQFKFLVEQGFRVLRFDLYGRGFSERVKGEHGSELFMAQLTDLFSFLNIDRPFHLVGLSMGGAISTRYASHHSDMVKSLFLVDCYGIPTPNDPGMLVVRPRGIGEALIGTLGGAILKRAPIKGVYDKKKHASFAKWFSAPLAVKGSKRALLSTLRHFMLENHVPHYKRVDHLDMNKLILWGKHDQVLPLKYGKEIHALMPSAEFVVLENCGHVPQYEEPEEVNALIKSFIEKSQ